MQVSNLHFIHVKCRVETQQFVENMHLVLLTLTHEAFVTLWNPFIN